VPFLGGMSSRGGPAAYRDWMKSVFSASFRLRHAHAFGGESMAPCSHAGRARAFLGGMSSRSVDMLEWVLASTQGSHAHAFEGKSMAPEEGLG
jgi:hypothetical protein